MLVRESISVVIPNLHSPVLDGVLQALRPQMEAWQGEIDVWVVGQDRYGFAQSDRLATFLETDGPVLPARSRNLGAEKSRGELLIFLDADCLPQPGWLEALVAAYRRWPDAGAISGAMSPDAATFPLHCGQIASFHDHLDHNPRGARDLLASFSMLVPRRVWGSAGGMNEDFFPGEDLDFSIRISQNGYALYFEPAAVVVHAPSRGSWGALWSHAVRAGDQSAQVRGIHDDWYRMPAWSRSSLAWRVLSPGIGVVRAVQIYATKPWLWQYWRCLPWVILSKVAWCWGAARGTEQARASNIRAVSGGS